MVRFADASYFIALLPSKDEYHARANRIAHSVNVPISTTGWVVAEVADALCKQPDRDKVVAFYDWMRSNPLITIYPPTLDQMENGFELFKSRRDKDWSLTDCISFQVMSEVGVIEALTADHHFQQAGFRALLIEN